MAEIIKQRLRRYNGTDYDTIYLETSSTSVVRSNGHTVETDLADVISKAGTNETNIGALQTNVGNIQDDLDDYLPEGQVTDDEPAASKEGKLIIGPNSVWIHGQDLMNSAQGCSRSVMLTLTSSAWEGNEAPYTQRYYISGLVAGQDGILGDVAGLTDAEYEEIANADLALTSQDATSITITARGDKPTMDIHKQLILFTTATDEGVLIGSCPQAFEVTLEASEWDATEKTQTITLQGIVADELKQKVEPVPAKISSDAYFAANVRAIEQGTDEITFKCDTIPENDLTVYVLITAIIRTDGPVPVGTSIGVHQYATQKNVTTTTTWTDLGDGWYRQQITVPGALVNTQIDLIDDEDVTDQMEADGCTKLFVKNVDGTLYLMAKNSPLTVAVMLTVNLKEVY